MQIFIGTDHHGYRLKYWLKNYLANAGHQVVDDGDQQLDPNDDFPVFAAKVAQHVIAAGPSARGILLCGSGQGMAMAANRFRGIRAIVGYDIESARVGRNDDDSNVLCLPADQLDEGSLKPIIDIWLNTEFAAADRFKRRLDALDRLS